MVKVNVTPATWTEPKILKGARSHRRMRQMWRLCLATSPRLTSVHRRILLSRFCTRPSRTSSAIQRTQRSRELTTLTSGVGGFLANVGFAQKIGQPSGPGIGTGVNPNPEQWAQFAPQFYGKVRVPTLRNVDMRRLPERSFRVGLVTLRSLRIRLSPPRRRQYLRLMSLSPQPIPTP
jgi:hypothetical protein